MNTKDKKPAQQQPASKPAQTNKPANKPNRKK
jgi:hypothetical protein